MMINVYANVKNYLIKVLCKCKELIDKGICHKGYIWNPSNCKYQCDKSCNIGEYLDYENCKFRKILVDKLIEECNEIIEETSLVKINSTKCKSNFCTLYIVLFSVFFTILTILELLLIFFTINTWILINKMFLHMIMFIM